ncbi:MAG: ATP cone domain-containing protein [Bacteroidaceae bacterium]
MEQIQVIKRDGTLAAIDLSMIHEAVEWACNGYDNVSVSDIEINSRLQFYDKITTVLSCFRLTKLIYNPYIGCLIYLLTS